MITTNSKERQRYRLWIERLGIVRLAAQKAMRAQSPTARARARAELREAALSVDAMMPPTRWTSWARLGDAMEQENTFRAIGAEHDRRAL